MSWQPSTHLLRDILGQVDTVKLHKIFIGDPMIIPQSYLPCVVIAKNNAKHTYSATSTDRIVESVIIKVIFNKMDDFGAPDDTDLTEERLAAAIEGCDPVTGAYLPGSFLGILRSNQLLGSFGTGNWRVGVDTEVDYYIDNRSNDRNNPLITQEGHIKLTLTSDKIVNRA